ncbi:MAG: STAS domain-containing protein [Hyphomicrobium sp.]
MARRKAEAKGQKTARKVAPRPGPKTVGTRPAPKPRPRGAKNTAHVLPQAVASAAFHLPESLDTTSAFGLREAILARRGNPLIVDAGQVRRTGMQAVQVLIAAARTWRSDGHDYLVTNATDEFLDTIALVGLSRECLSIEGVSV